jgi:hypothetical protein
MSRPFSVGLPVIGGQKLSGEGAMQIHIAARGFGKALVVISQEFG